MNQNDWVVTMTYALEPDMGTMDRWEEQLGDDATISRVPGRGINVTIHADDTTLDQALEVARASAAEVIVCDPVGVEIITDDEQLRRSQETTAPELMSASEVAETLNVTRQRVHQLRATEQFPKPLADLRGGAVWDARAIRRFAAEWPRRPGRPPVSGWAVLYERLLGDNWCEITDQMPTESEAHELYRLLLIDTNARNVRLISGSVRPQAT